MPDLLALSFLAAAAVAVVAGMVRGFAGFGAAMMMTPVFSALYGPETGIALCLLLEIAVALPLLPRAVKYVDWRRIGLLMVAAVAGAPIGNLALTWIAVGMGLSSPNAEAAANSAQPLVLLPLISSAFIPADTMPGWFRPIAEYQPFTPAIETLRGLLLGTEIGHHGWLAVAWCLGLAVLGYFWATSKYDSEAE